MLTDDGLSAYDPIWRASDALLYGLDFVLRYARPMAIFETGVGASSLSDACRPAGSQVSDPQFDTAVASAAVTESQGLCMQAVELRWH